MSDEGNNIGGKKSKFLIDIKKPVKPVGSRREVFNGTAKKTSGGLTKTDLFMNKYHRIVSKKKYLSAKRENRLQKHGYFAKKGSFGVIFKGKRTRKNKK